MPQPHPAELWRLAPAAWARAVTASPDAKKALVEAVERTLAAHPAIALEPSAFVAHLAHHVPPDELVATLPHLYLDDLYLCCAALNGNLVAIYTFEQLVGRIAETLLVRAGVTSTDRADLTQQAHVKMLVAAVDNEPKLARYAGRGPLVRWLRAALLRSLLDVRRRARPETLLAEDDWLTWPSLADDPELARIKHTYRNAFKRAATEALAALAPRAKLLLRQHLLDDVGVAQLAPLYGVHAATIYRWLDDARGTLVRDTRQRLTVALRVDSVEVDRLLELLESQLEVSVRRLLEAE